MSEKLPMNGASEGSGGPEGPPPASEVPAWRLISTLTVAGTLAGLLIVLVFQWADPRIQAHRAARLQEAIQEVLGEPDHYETLFVHEGRLTPELPPGRDTLDMERVFVGYDGSGNRVGYAVLGSKPGFQDVIELIFGYDAASGEVLGMKVLESKETPGLGDKILKDSSFIGEFEGVETPLLGVKAGRSEGEGGEVDLITGATISSEAVIDIINERVSEVGPLLESYTPGRSVAGSAPGRNPSSSGSPPPGRTADAGRSGGGP